jgi:hypothetical protein
MIHGWSFGLWRERWIMVLRWVHMCNIPHEGRVSVLYFRQHYSIHEFSEVYSEKRFSPITCRLLLLHKKPQTPDGVNVSMSQVEWLILGFHILVYLWQVVSIVFKFEVYRWEDPGILHQENFRKTLINYFIFNSTFPTLAASYTYVGFEVSTAVVMKSIIFWGYTASCARRWYSCLLTGYSNQTISSSSMSIYGCPESTPKLMRAASCRFSSNYTSLPQQLIQHL